MGKRRRTCWCRRAGTAFGPCRRGRTEESCCAAASLFRSRASIRWCWEIWLRKENEEPELLFSEAGARETTEYVVLPEGEYSLEFRDSKGRTVTEALGIEIVPGRFYTVYLLGRSLPEEEDYPVISVQLWDANSSVPLCTREPR